MIMITSAVEVSWQGKQHTYC